MTDEQLMIRKWEKLVNQGKLFEMIEFNTQPKMTECYNKLKVDAERKAQTWVTKLGDQVLGYYVLYLPNWRRIKAI